VLSRPWMSQVSKELPVVEKERFRSMAARVSPRAVEAQGSRSEARASRAIEAKESRSTEAWGSRSMGTRGSLAVEAQCLESTD
jgi:hypothetical protein